MQEYFVKIIIPKIDECKSQLGREFDDLIKVNDFSKQNPNYYLKSENHLEPLFEDEYELIDYDLTHFHKSKNYVKAHPKESKTARLLIEFTCLIKEGKEIAFAQHFFQYIKYLIADTKFQFSMETWIETEEVKKYSTTFEVVPPSYQSFTDLSFKKVYLPKNTLEIADGDIAAILSLTSEQLFPIKDKTKNVFYRIGMITYKGITGTEPCYTITEQRIREMWRNLTLVNNQISFSILSSRNTKSNENVNIEQLLNTNIDELRISSNELINFFNSLKIQNLKELLGFNNDGFIFRLEKIQCFYI